jgi:hypothetical protein
MGQIQWMIGLIPDAVLSWTYWAIIIAGITGVLAGWLGKWIPFYGNYVRVLQPVGIVLLVLGVWLRGGYDTEMVWRAKVAEMQEKVDLAAAQSASANDAIKEDINKKTVEVKQKSETIVKYVDRYKDREVLKTIEGPERVRVEEVIKYVENCPVPKEFIDLHNDAARLNKKPEGDKK